MIYEHQSVMPKEVLDFLNPRPGQSFIDCTLGGAGHTISLAKAVAPNGQVLAIDLDQDAIDHAELIIKEEELSDIVLIKKGNFKNLQSIVEELAPEKKFDGILLDLGISTYQLQHKKKGFGFSADSLDMRMDPSQILTAQAILKKCSSDELVEIFKNYGEEKLARPIANKIIELRTEQPTISPQMLVEEINQVYHRFYRRPSQISPATKVFMALRIAVNDELNNLRNVLPQAISLLKPQGRLVVISFHSLEDRIVKEFFKRESLDCICPASLMICECQHQASLKIITKKPLEPSEEEIKINPKARSAKMRVIERL